MNTLIIKAQACTLTEATLVLIFWYLKYSSANDLCFSFIACFILSKCLLPYHIPYIDSILFSLMYCSHCSHCIFLNKLANDLIIYNLRHRLNEDTCWLCGVPIIIIIMERLLHIHIIFSLLIPVIEPSSHVYGKWWSCKKKPVQLEFKRIILGIIIWPHFQRGRS